MMFDREQWPVIARYEETTYAGVATNRVEVTPARGKGYVVHIRIPSAFFPMLTQVFRDSMSARTEPITLYLDEVAGKWFFGFRLNGEDVDLWPYRALPFWGRQHEA